MYEQFFGMRERPFSLTPDTSFFFYNKSHQEALNVLMVSLHVGEGFIKVTGEVGTGKTLLCRQLLKQLDESYVSVFIPNPFLEPSALWMAIADELEIEFTDDISPHRLHKLITQRLVELTKSNKRIVICLDEAQSMPLASLEALRLLTNLETEKNKLLQVVLFGQPELNDKLNEPSIRQLKQRISHSYTLSPLDRSAVDGYIAHRLLVAGYNGAPLFLPTAIDAMYRASQGIPRLINILSSKALMIAYGRGDKAIKSEHIEVAAEDTDGVFRQKSNLPSMLLNGLIIITAGALATGLWMLWSVT